MDGNGRWAQRRHLPRVAGHRAGVESARTIIETCARLNIPALTLYAFSLENWRRPKAEIDFLMRLLRQYLRKELPVHSSQQYPLADYRPHRSIARGRAGRRRKGHGTDRSNTGMCADGGAQLRRARGIGGRLQRHPRPRSQESAPTATAAASFRVDEETIAEHLYTAGLPDPDLLIRTSGEMRVSNFLLWQIAYAEIYVTETLWPDFRRAELYAALADYQKRERRYGGLADGTSRSPGLAAGMTSPSKQILTANAQLEATASSHFDGGVLIPAVVALVWWGPTALVAAFGRFGHAAGSA